MAPDDFWPDFPRKLCARYVDDEGTVHWPESRQEQTQLARALFGRSLMQSFDYWLDNAIDYLDNPEPEQPFPRKNEAFREDQYFRSELTTLTDRQARAVRSLIQDAMHGVLFSMLVAMDQPQPGEAARIFIAKDEESEAAHNLVPLLHEDEDDLHDCLAEWMLSFSSYAEEMVEHSRSAEEAWEIGPKLAHRKSSTQSGQ